MAFGFGKTSRRRERADLPDDDMVGLLEPGVEIEGKMRIASGLIRVNSHFKGEITSEGRVVVAEQGEVEADIYAKHVSIAGKVKGTVHASDLLEIKERGMVLGDIYTPCLAIDPGGYFDGQCHMPTPEPEKPPAAEPASKARP